MTSQQIFQMLNAAKNASNGIKTMRNGYILGNPYVLARQNKKNANGFTVINKPWAYHFDIAMTGKDENEKIDHALSTKTAEMFKRLANDNAKLMNKLNRGLPNIEFYVYMPDNLYVRFELLTSHEELADLMECVLPMLNFEHDVVCGRQNGKTESELHQMADKAMNQMKDNVYDFYEKKGIDLNNYDL